MWRQCAGLSQGRYDRHIARGVSKVMVSEWGSGGTEAGVENMEELLSGLEGGVGMTGRVRSRYTPGRVWP